MPATNNICPECHEPIYGAWCETCFDNCRYCGDLHLKADMHRVPGSMRPYCTTCIVQCDTCGNWTLPHSEPYCTGRYTPTCSRCAVACRDCGRRVVRSTEPGWDAGGFCEDCLGNRLTGVNPYRHTRPQRWLGGPTPKQDGHQQAYYLGFELEITAHRGSTAPLYAWAKEHLGFEDGIDCKSDSSVVGFEIASQPMTKEFFESIPWEGFFEVMNETFPPDLGDASNLEPPTHGLHVHIGKVAFERDDFAYAAFCYLLNHNSGKNLERIGRRSAYHYCAKVRKAASTALVDSLSHKPYGGRQFDKLMNDSGTRPGRDAINLTNTATVEIRAFRSTRSAQELRDAVRLVYVTAEYVRALRKGHALVSPKALHWSVFCDWVKENYPDAYASISGEVTPVAEPAPTGDFAIAS